MPVSMDLAAPIGMAPPLPRLRPARPPVIEEEELRRLPPRVPLPSAPPVITEEELRRLPDKNAGPPGAPDSAFSPLPGGGWATPSMPWNGAVTDTPLAAPGGAAPGIGLDQVRQFFGAPPRMEDFSRSEYVPGGGIPTRRIDPSFAPVMAAYNQGTNALLNRMSNMEQTGLGMTELLGPQGGPPGRLATAARAAEAQMLGAQAADRSATSQYGPENTLATAYNAYETQRRAQGASTPIINREWEGMGRRLPIHAGGPGAGAPSGGPPPVTGAPIVHPGAPTETPEAITANVMRALEEARSLSVPWIFPAAGPGVHTTATGQPGWRGRRREELLRNAGVPDDVIRQLANTNLLATGGSGILDDLVGTRGTDPGLDMPLLQRRLAEILRRRSTRPSPIAP
jgi:hypothetical protein